MWFTPLLQGAAQQQAGGAAISRPSSDITATGWSASTGTDLYAMLDESVADDTDYITSPPLGSSPGPAVFAVTPTQTAAAINVRFRARRTGLSGQIRALLLDAAGSTIGTSAWQSLTNTASAYTLVAPTSGTTARVRLEVQAETTLAPALSTSRTSGAAPLAVHFDATNTVSTAVADPFRQVTYSFAYGDSGSGTWATNSASKNSDSGGPIGAHVYETAGTYTVTVTANDGTSTASTTATITVSDPNTVYSGTNTICITNGSTGANDWGPAGCAYQATLPSGGAAWTGKRVLFKRGVDYTALGRITVPRTSSNVRIGAAGTGAKPLIRAININADARPTTAEWAEDVVVSDIDFRAVGSSEPAINHNQCGRNILILRCDIADPTATATSTENQIIFGAALDYWAQVQGSLAGGGWNGGGDPSRVLARSAFYVPKYIFVVECYQRGAPIRPTISYNALHGSFSSAAFMGNDFRIAGEHMHRLYLARKTLIQHSKLEDIGKDTVRHAIKMMSGGTRVPQENVEDRPDGLTWYTEQIIIRNNILGAPDSFNDWTVQIGPQNDDEPEGVVDTILENNTFINAASKSQEINIGPSRRATTRGNVLTGGTMRIAENVATYPEPIQSGWRGPYYGQFTG